MAERTTPVASSAHEQQLYAQKYIHHEPIHDQLPPAAVHTGRASLTLWAASM